MKVPVYETQQVQARDLGTPYSNVRVDPDAHGAAFGRGLQGLGAGVGKVGDVASAIWREEREKQNRARISETRNALRAWEQQNLYDPKTGLTNYKGKNALGLQKRLSDEAGAYSQKLLEGLDGEQQGIARDVVETWRMGVAKETSTWESREIDNAADGEHEALIKNSIEVGANKLDDEGRMLAKNEGEEAIWARGHAKGVPEAEIVANIRQYRTIFHAKILKGLTAEETGNAAEAKSYFDKWGEELDAETRGTIRELIVGRGDREKALGLAADISEKYGTLKEQYDAARQLEGGVRLQELTINEIEKRWQIAKAERTDDIKQALGRTRSQIERAGGILDSHTNDFLKVLDDDGRADAEAYARQVRIGNRTATNDERRIQNELNAFAVSEFNKITTYEDQLSLDVDAVDAPTAFRQADQTTRNNIKAQQVKIGRLVDKGAQADRAQFKTLVEGNTKKLKGKALDQVKSALNVWYDSHETPPSVKEATAKIADSVLVYTVEKDWAIDSDKPAILLTEEEKKIAKLKAGQEAPTPAPTPTPAPGLTPPTGQKLIRFRDPKTGREGKAKPGKNPKGTEVIGYVE